MINVLFARGSWVLCLLLQAVVLVEIRESYQPLHTCNYKKEYYNIFADNYRYSKTLQVVDSPGLLNVSGNVGDKAMPIKIL